MGSKRTNFFETPVPQRPGGKGDKKGKETTEGDQIEVVGEDEDEETAHESSAEDTTPIIRGRGRPRGRPRGGRGGGRAGSRGSRSTSVEHRKLQDIPSRVRTQRRKWKRKLPVLNLAPIPSHVIVPNFSDREQRLIEHKSQEFLAKLKHYEVLGVSSNVPNIK